MKEIDTSGLLGKAFGYAAGNTILGTAIVYSIQNQPLGISIVTGLAAAFVATVGGLAFGGAESFNSMEDKYTSYLNRASSNVLGGVALSSLVIRLI